LKIYREEIYRKIQIQLKNRLRMWQTKVIKNLL